MRNLLALSKFNAINVIAVCVSGTLVTATLLFTVATKGTGFLLTSSTIRASTTPAPPPCYSIGSWLAPGCGRRADLANAGDPPDRRPSQAEPPRRHDRPSAMAAAAREAFGSGNIATGFHE
jgi:hypothetical protein